MTIRATDRHGSTAPAPNPAALRVAMLDSDTGFVQVLRRRLDGAGHHHVQLGSPVPADRLVAMRLDALVVDPSTLGDQAWPYLDGLVGRLPSAGFLVCTERSSVAQRVRGLRLGADDWITKPCHPEEVVARIEAIVRRRRRTDVSRDAAPLVSGEITLDRSNFQALVRATPLDLTPREFQLLELLIPVEGRVLTREEIYERVWGYTLVRGDRSVDVFVRKVRMKLGKASPGWNYVHTHFGIGYRWQAEPVSVADHADEPVPELAGLRS